MKPFLIGLILGAIAMVAVQQKLGKGGGDNAAA